MLVSVVLPVPVLDEYELFDDLVARRTTYPVGPDTYVGLDMDLTTRRSLIISGSGEFLYTDRPF